MGLKSHSPEVESQPRSLILQLLGRLFHPTLLGWSLLETSR